METTDEQNVVVIFGPGTHGKSSLLDSIRWLILGNSADLEMGLQGTYKIFDGADSEDNLHNIDERDAGNFFLHVGAELTDTELGDIKIIRKAWKDENGKHSNRFLAVDMSTGKIIHDSEEEGVSELMTQILSQDLIKLLLVSGDDLERYTKIFLPKPGEELLPSTKAQLDRGASIQAITLGESALGSIEPKIQEKKLNKDRDFTKVIDAQSSLEENINQRSEMIKQRTGFQNELNTLKDVIERYQISLAGKSSDSNLIQTRDEKEELANQAKEEYERQLGEVRNSNAESYLPILNRFYGKIYKNSCEKFREEKKTLNNKMYHLSGQLELLSKDSGSKEKKCEICGLVHVCKIEHSENLDPEQLTKDHEIAKNKESEVSQSLRENEEYDSIINKFNCEEFLSSVDSLEKAKSAYKNAKFASKSAQSAVENVDVDGHETLKEKLSSAVNKRDDELQPTIVLLTKNIDRKTITINGLRGLSKKKVNQDVVDELSMQVDLVSKLRQRWTTLETRYRKILIREAQASLNDSMKEMLPIEDQKKFAQWSVNPEWRIRCKTEDGNHQPVTNPMHKSIATMALLEAIRGAGGHYVPCAFDNPFSKIDDRDSITIDMLKWFSSRPVQVILLGHGRHFKPDDFKSLKGSIAKAYTLEGSGKPGRFSTKVTEEVL